MLSRLLLIAALALPLSLFAQEQKQEKKQEPKPEAARAAAAPVEAGRVYKLDYLLSELESGKRTDAHEYSMLVDAERPGKLRVGNRVPVSANPGQWQY